MDHSEMPGMGAKQPTAGASPAQPGPMQGMENKQPGGTPPPAPRGEMQGMDHSKMPGMGAKPPSAEPPPSKEALDTEMKKTSDEMKRLSDELKAKSDAAKDTEKPGHKPPAVAASPTVSYTCPMHPEVQQPKPGKCPKCGMTLVQKEAPRKEEKK